ncbi:hypothetical protein M433DRAFT_390130 [Acidomyces richmondensis BFW]|nr:MAG: hypothetical protein FE78DRAFT_453667 [Acidomyces sp. 'richmondensis']KYG50448.1 hypothetical protein M433DRAFT_390130 [Acidomyces richmondensis BFW]
MQTAVLGSQLNTAPRKRIAKACDQCNGRRAKCDGERPCKSCRECCIHCTYNRESRRQSRVVRAKSKRQAIVPLYASDQARTPP